VIQEDLVQEAFHLNVMMLTSIKSVVIKAFEPYLIHSFVKVTADRIGPLTSKLIVKAGLKPDSQRYFDYHHAANDKLTPLTKENYN
jgi:hypothetical protein